MCLVRTCMCVLVTMCMCDLCVFACAHMCMSYTKLKWYMYVYVYVYPQVNNSSKTYTSMTKYLVTIARFGAVKLAPINSAKFSCLVFFNMDTSSVNFAICSGVASGSKNLLMATSPCQYPLKTSATGPLPTRSTIRMSL